MRASFTWGIASLGFGNGITGFLPPLVRLVIWVGDFLIDTVAHWFRLLVSVSELVLRISVVD